MFCSWRCASVCSFSHVSLEGWRKRILAHADALLFRRLLLSREMKTALSKPFDIEQGRRAFFGFAKIEMNKVASDGSAKSHGDEVGSG
jgi:hypothetical protein